MSIDTLKPTDTMGSLEKNQEKDGKKHKSSHGEKKRKRDHTSDPSQSKSKKHRKETNEDVVADLTETSSPFHMQTATFYLPLAPIAQQYPLEGLCAEHISPLLLTYYPPLSAVILSYTNVRLSEKPYGADDPEELKFQNIDEYAVSWAWLTADFLLFKPVEGIELEGYINLQSQGHVGVVCWNLFNASIEATRLPKTWRWKDISEMSKTDGNEGYAQEGAGCWVDENGDKIEGKIIFRVSEVDSSSDKERGFLSIEGTMLSAEEEEALQESSKNEAQAVKEKRPRERMTNLSVPVEKSLTDPGEGGGKKHRRKF